MILPSKEEELFDCAILGKKILLIHKGYSN